MHLIDTVRCHARNVIERKLGIKIFQETSAVKLQVQYRVVIKTM
jgi:hypothetical protein